MDKTREILQSVYYSDPNRMYQALNSMAAQAAASSRRRASAQPAQSRLQKGILSLVSVALIVLLLAVAGGRI